VIGESRIALRRRGQEPDPDAEAVTTPPPPQAERRAPLTPATVLALQHSAGNAAVVARLKDDTERADDAVDTIDEINGLLATAISKHAQYNAAMQQLSMEGISSGTSSGKRSLVRAATLAYLTVGNRKAADAADIKAKLVKMDKADLRVVLSRWVPDDVVGPQAGRSSFPALGASKKEKKAWDPEQFAEPAEHAAGKSFRYIVIALQNQAKDKNRAYKYTHFLENPGILENFMNSTSVIDEEHRGTYTPYGFIIRVPAENVEVASPKDVSIANQSGDIEAETERQHAKHGLPEPGRGARPDGSAQGSVAPSLQRGRGARPHRRGHHQGDGLLRQDAGRRARQALRRGEGQAGQGRLRERFADEGDQDVGGCAEGAHRLHRRGRPVAGQARGSRRGDRLTALSIPAWQL
jgi:hypothetical protein